MRFAARPRRGGQLPGGDQDRRRMVSEDASARSPPASSIPAPTSARSSTPLVVPWITLHVRLGLGVHRDRRARASSGWSRGSRCTSRPMTHPRLSAGRAARTSAAIRRSRRRAVPWRQIAAAPADLGVRDRQVPDRSDLVAVPVLDSGFPQPELRARPDARSVRRSSSIYLVADVGSIGGGWLSSALIGRGWTVNARAQDGDARVRAGRRADRVRVERQQPVGRGGARRPGGRRAPGLVGEPVHAGVGHVPAARRSARSSASAAWRARSAAC